jgi:hypothetical protein
MNLDYTGWDQPDFSERAVGQIEEGNRLGAAGFKEYKRLGNAAIHSHAGSFQITVDISRKYRNF